MCTPSWKLAYSPKEGPYGRQSKSEVESKEARKKSRKTHHEEEEVGGAGAAGGHGYPFVISPRQFGQRQSAHEYPSARLANLFRGDVSTPDH